MRSSPAGPPLVVFATGLFAFSVWLGCSATPTQSKQASLPPAMKPPAVESQGAAVTPSTPLSATEAVHPAGGAIRGEEDSPVSVLLTSAAKQTFDAVRATIPVPGVAGGGIAAAEIQAFQKFDFAFDLPTVAGERVSSKSFAGQLMVIDIWATWCAPCKKGIPELIELQSEYENQGIQVIGITCDARQPDEEQIAQSARRAYHLGQQMHINYPLLVDNGSTIPQIPGFRVYPTTLFMTADGKVRYQVTGMQSKEKLASIITTILAL